MSLRTFAGRALMVLAAFAAAAAMIAVLGRVSPP